MHYFNLVGGCLTKLIRNFVLFGFTLMIFFSFQNCNKVQMSDVGSVNNKSGSGVQGDPVEARPPLPKQSDPVNTPIVVTACNTPNRQKISQNFLFPKPNNTCEWEVNGNLKTRDQFFQARIEQEQTLTLPPGSIICDIKFNFGNQKFLYDDHFLMTFDNAIIASSYYFVAVLDRQFNLFRYNWSKIAGMVWDKKMEGDFCAPDGVCSWPKTDTEGQINMNFASSVFQKIMAEDLNRNVHSMKFISIGDNDDKDCEHSDVNFSLDVEFVVPQ